MSKTMKGRKRRLAGFRRGVNVGRELLGQNSNGSASGQEEKNEGILIQKKRKGGG